jgi:uncharacterized protein (TIGR02145 family)
MLQQGIAQSIKTFTDQRDGQMYKTINFKNDSTGTTFTRMAQNLNYKTLGSYAYDDTIKNRNELGLLYTVEDAMKACPSGWHLPMLDKISGKLIKEFLRYEPIKDDWYL